MPAILALFLIVYFLMLRPVKKQFLTSLRELPALARSAKPAEITAGTTTVGGIEIELPPGSEQAKHATALKKKLTEKVKSEPAAASRLIQGWIREGRPVVNPAPNSLAGVRKAAVLLVLLGEEMASQIYRHLPQQDLERVTQAIAELEYIDPQTALACWRNITAWP